MRRRWTAEEDAALIRMRGDGTAMALIERALGRTRASVAKRAPRLGVADRTPAAGRRLWSSDDDAALARLWGEDAPVSSIARALGRTRDAVNFRIKKHRRRLGLSSRRTTRTRP